MVMGIAPARGRESERRDGEFATGWLPEREAPRRPSWSEEHGYCRSEDHPVVLARHPLQQARALPVERQAREGRRLGRRTGRVHRPARPDPVAACPAGGRCRGQGDRHVRGARRRPPLPGAGTAGELEAPQQDRPGALCRVRGRRRHPDRRGLARREYRARAAASARPVPRLPGDAREGHDRGGNRRGLLRRRQGREAAPASRVHLADAARHLCRGRHDPRAAHGLHRLRGPRAPGAGLGGDQGRLAEGALLHPSPDDRDHGQGLGQAGGIRRHRGL